MFLSVKVPKYLLGKYQLIGTVTFTVLFGIVFLNVYIPFSDIAWFGLANSDMFLRTVLFVVFSVFVLILSRMLMYQSGKLIEITYLGYIVWCIAEITAVSGIYAALTLDEFVPVGQTRWDIFSKVLASSTISLGIPYLIAGMYFAIIDQNNTIRLMNYENVVTDEPEDVHMPLKKISLYDNSGSMKLSLNLESLYYIESDDNYIKVWYTDSKSELTQYMLRCKLKTIEESFRENGLIRCNRRYIVNIHKVATLRKESDGYYLDLDNEAIPSLPVTKTYTASVLRYFTENKPLLENIGEE